MRHPRFAISGSLAVRPGAAEFLNPILAEEIEARWHAIGRRDVKVWTEKVRREFRDGRDPAVVVAHEIRSSLRNGI